MKYFTLLQLNKSIQKLITDINRDFWIVAEIAQAQLGRHAYLELVQKEGEALVAKARANIWQGTIFALRNTLGTDLESLLRTGTKVLMRVSVTFHEVHGLSLNITEIDPSYTLGELEQRRIETIRRLEAEGLLLLQPRLPLPVVVQRIAVISSPDAAGYSDFMAQLAGNAYGYAFDITFFPASVQGQKAESELIEQLKRASQENFHAIVLIRGGGSKLDLEVFNAYHLAATIAQLSTPVLTGIGHQRDLSVCDMAAHAQFKTPTAVAEFLLQRMLHFESYMQTSLMACGQSALVWLSQEKEMLRVCAQRVYQSSQRRVQQEQQRVILVEQQVFGQAQRVLERAQYRLDKLEREIELVDPQYILSRGFTISYWEGKAVSARQLPPAGSSMTTLGDGFQVQSRVENTSAT